MDCDGFLIGAAVCFGVLWYMFGPVLGVALSIVSIGVFLVAAEHAGRD